MLALAQKNQPWEEPDSDVPELGERDDPGSRWHLQQEQQQEQQQ
jgi:hypothetical protein